MHRTTGFRSDVVNLDLHFGFENEKNITKASTDSLVKEEFALAGLVLFQG